MTVFTQNIRLIHLGIPKGFFHTGVHIGLNICIGIIALVMSRTFLDIPLNIRIQVKIGRTGIITLQPFVHFCKYGTASCFISQRINNDTGIIFRAIEHAGQTIQSRRQIICIAAWNTAVSMCLKICLIEDIQSHLIRKIIVAEIMTVM